ncbi:hypothetical protein B0H13DRAFT_1871868 [Mycena leptocephala]|nr:hypothetical protein B0H13DRAFT_1871868 [Mycena leptocephala]
MIHELDFKPDHGFHFSAGIFTLQFDHFFTDLLSPFRRPRCAAQDDDELCVTLVESTEIARVVGRVFYFSLPFSTGLLPVSSPLVARKAHGAVLECVRRPLRVARKRSVVRWSRAGTGFGWLAGDSNTVTACPDSGADRTPPSTFDIYEISSSVEDASLNGVTVAALSTPVSDALEKMYADYEAEQEKAAGKGKRTTKQKYGHPGPLNNAQRPIFPPIVSESPSQSSPIMNLSAEPTIHSNAPKTGRPRQEVDPANILTSTSKWAGDEESGRPISPSEPSPIVKATPAAPPTLSNATNKGPRQEVDPGNILASARARIPSHRKRVAEESERAKKKVKGGVEFGLNQVQQL